MPAASSNTLPPWQRCLPPRVQLLVGAYLSLLLLFALWRLIFLGYFLQDFGASPASTYARAFWVALRLDSTISADLLAPLAIFAFLPRIGWPSRVFQRGARLYMTAVVLLISVLCGIDIEWFREFGSHMNALLVTYSREGEEVYTSIWEFYPVLTYAAVWVVITYAYWRLFGWWSRRWRTRPESRPFTRLVAALLVAAALVIGARGGLQERPVNWGVAHFSTDNMANALAQNCVYFLARSVIEFSSEQEFARALEVRRNTPVDATLADLRARNSAPRLDLALNLPPGTHPNIMLVVLESFTAENCDFLNPSLPSAITPNLARIAASGISFSRCYSNGIRSAYGLGTVLCAWPVLPGKPLISQLETTFQDNPATAPLRLLREFGYTLAFIYGGDAHFDNMKGFALTNGFDQVIDWSDPRLAAAPDGTMWGRFDHHLFDRVLQAADESKSEAADRPFFFTIFTTTNHEPFELPKEFAGSATPMPAGAKKYERARATMAYDDQVIAAFLEQAAQRPWYGETLFIFTADHGLTIHRDISNHPQNGHIPLVLHTAALNHPARIDKIVSQADLLPTLFDLMGESQYLPQFLGVSGLREGPGFACRVTHQQLQWIEDGFFYNEFLGAKAHELFAMEDPWQLPYTRIDDNAQRLHTLQTRCRAYLRTAFILFKGMEEQPRPAT
jgi:phosphoglycerol transferase MdoB-like AlkP superfamily enzyme